jgi:hypothetical protein
MYSPSNDFLSYQAHAISQRVFNMLFSPPKMAGIKVMRKGVSIKNVTPQFRNKVMKRPRCCLDVPIVTRMIRALTQPDRSHVVCRLLRQMSVNRRCRERLVARNDLTSASKNHLCMQSQAASSRRRLVRPRVLFRDILYRSGTFDSPARLVLE